MWFTIMRIAYFIKHLKLLYACDNRAYAIVIYDAMVKGLKDEIGNRIHIVSYPNMQLNQMNVRNCAFTYLVCVLLWCASGQFYS